MAISLTEWWQNLLNNLQYIDQRFSQLDLAKTSSFIALTKMANLGINLENPNNSLFDLKSLDEQIQKHEKSLTYLFTNPLNQQSYRLPAIDSPATSLIALIYLLHLQDFHKIQSSVALIQNGVQLLGKNGVSQNKPLVAENTEHYHAYVANALAQHQQPLLEQLPELAEVEGDNLINRCKLLLSSDKSLEDKIAARIAQDFEDCHQQAIQQPEEILAFFNLFYARIKMRQKALSQIAICMKLLKKLEAFANSPLDLFDFLSAHENLFIKFLMLSDTKTHKYWNEKYIQHSQADKEHYLYIKEHPSQSEQQASYFSYLTAPVGYVASGIGKVLSALTPAFLHPSDSLIDTVTQKSKAYILEPSRSLIESTLGYQFSTSSKISQEDLKDSQALKSLAKDKIQQLAATLSTEDVSVSSRDFAGKSASDVIHLASRIQLLNTISDTKTALQNLSKHTEYGMVKFANWGIFGMVSRLFASHSFFARLLNDSLRLNYEISSVQKTLSFIEENFETHSSVVQTKAEFEQAMLELKGKSSQIQRDSLYMLFKDKSRAHLSATNALASQAIHHAQQLTTRPTRTP